MTLDPLMTRERMVIPKRPSLSPAAKRRIYDRERGKCRWCVVVLKLSGPEVMVDLQSAEFDHWDMRAVSGDDSEANYFPLHKACHRVKTRTQDSKRIAKVKRQEALTRPKVQSKRPIQSRGFQKGVSRPLQSRPFQRKP